MWTISKKFRFEASHQLPHHDGKCRRLHGHSWVGYVYLSGRHLQTEGPKQGMVMDFSEVKQHLKPLVESYLDHYHLNDTLNLLNPTSESVARWIYDKLKPSLPALVAVRIDETCTSSCIYAPGLDPSYGLGIASNAVAMG